MNASTSTRRAHGQDDSEAALRLAELAVAPTVERALDAVREFLGMEVTFIGRITAETEVVEVVRGEGNSFGFTEGRRIPLSDTYCQRVLQGRLPNLIRDVRADDRARSLAVTTDAEVGAFVSIPLRFSDASLYGMLCGASHDPKPGLGYRELQFLNVLARTVCEVLEREQLQSRLHETEAHGAAVRVLLAALSSRDAFTGSHSESVVELAVAVAQRLGLSGPELDDVREVAMLHDAGKFAVPAAILQRH